MLQQELDAFLRTIGTNVCSLPSMFSAILPADYTAILRSGHVKQFDRGGMLHLEGDSVDRVVLLTSGLVKITKLGPAGREVILRLGKPGDVLGAAALFSDARHYTTAEVFRPCHGVVWDVAVFKRLVERFPVLSDNMVSVLGEHLRELEDRFREVATERVGSRVALQLLRLIHSIGRPVDSGIEVGLSREELAQMTGTTLFTVSRLISLWETRGIVKARREAVVVSDINLLRTISQEE
jgi:CRP-like cAMP-binding protein